MCDGNRGLLEPGTLRVSILPDKRIRIETGSFAGPVHASAEQAVQAICAILGVTQEDAVKIVTGLVQQHDHEHNRLKVGR